MNTIKTDVAIIGAGSAGLNARREAVKAGKDWVMIESGPFGTTCARVGCMPSKLLIAAADAAHEVENARRFGVEVDEGAWRVNAAEVFGRVRSERDRFAGFVVEDVLELDQSKVLRGYARFLDQTTLMIDDHTRVEAGAIVVATGSSPFVPPVFDGVRDKIMLNDDVFELDEVPESLAVIGAGVIGLELGQALGRLGASVRVFNIDDRIAFFSDDAVRDVALEAFSREMDFSLNSNITSATERDGKIALAWQDAEGNAHEQVFSHVLVAAGRRPNVTGMGLEDLDLPRDERGRIISSPCSTQVGDSPIFFAGDVSNHRPLLHEAADEGRIAGYNAARFPDVMVAFRRSKIGVAFTSPQMGFVGKRWEELDPADVVVGEVSYKNQGRARVMLQNEGLVRLYADRRNCRLIGGELLGPRVEHTAHLLTWAIQQEMRVPDILRMPFYHPVVEEGIRTALRDLATKLRVTSHCAPEDFALSPGL